MPDVAAYNREVKFIIHELNPANPDPTSTARVPVTAQLLAVMDRRDQAASYSAIFVVDGGGEEFEKALDAHREWVIAAQTWLTEHGVAITNDIKTAEDLKALVDSTPEPEDAPTIQATLDEALEKIQKGTKKGGAKNE